MKYIISAILLVATFAALFHYCSPSGVNKTGHEYMPDMAHSVAYEANTYAAYKWNTWDDKSTFTKRELSQPRGKVSGTIPRGQTAAYYGAAVAGSSASARNNGEAPFYYKNDALADGIGERERCQKEITSNPFPITKLGLANGKALYETYCGICHGKTGNGAGYLVSEENPEAKYPAQPANLMKDEFLGASEGRFYYAIMYGKNVMGNYTDKLSFEERWQVIHYVRSMQAASKNAEYSEGANTYSILQAEFAKKWAIEQAAAAKAAPAPVAAPATTVKKS
jgi:cytochrome c553